MFQVRPCLHAICWLAVVLPFGSAATARALGPDAAEKLLTDEGLRSVGDQFLLSEEFEIAKAIRGGRSLQKDLRDALKKKDALERKQRVIDQQIARLTQERRLLNAQLPQLLQIDVNRYNQGVARMNQINGYLRDLYEQKYESTEARDVGRELSGARQKYIDWVLGLKARVDAVKKRYAELAESEDVTEALETLSKAEGEEITLGPGRSLASTERSLAGYEKMIETNEIPLREQNGTFLVDVVLNGMATEELVFDTGASVISLPARIAARAGLMPTASDPTVIVTIADGSQVEAKEMILESVKIGPFEVNGVRAVVMPENLSNAPALLGGSFINNFTYSIDADAGKLTLSRIDD